MSGPDGPVLLRDESARLAVEPATTVADMCMAAAKGMVEQSNDTQRMLVLWEGGVYFFDVTCTGMKPPYEMKRPEPGSGETYWFGQRAN